MLKLFDSCIAPILLYESEVWAPFMNSSIWKWSVGSIHEFFYMKVKCGLHSWILLYESEVWAPFMNSSIWKWSVGSIHEFFYMKVKCGLHSWILLYESEVWAPFMNSSIWKWSVGSIHEFFYMKVKCGLHSWILLYESEVWTPFMNSSIWKWSVDSIHEFWLETMEYYTILRKTSRGQQIRYYEILHTGKRNSLYCLLKKYEQNLINHINENEGIRGLNKAKLCKIIIEEFNALWQTQVNSFRKADTYRQFTNGVKFESYLTDIKNRKLRVTFTKYRQSDHCLVIDKGRHKRSSVTQRRTLLPILSINSWKWKATFLPSVARTKIEMNCSTWYKGKYPNFVN